MPKLTIQGTKCYVAPELVQNIGNSNFLYNPFKADVYSLGICFHDILFLTEPGDIIAIRKRFSTICNQYIKKMLMNMVENDFDKRPSFSDCLEILSQVK